MLKAILRSPKETVYFATNGRIFSFNVEIWEYGNKGGLYNE